MTTKETLKELLKTYQNIESACRAEGKPAFLTAPIQHAIDLIEAEEREARKQQAAAKEKLEAEQRLRSIIAEEVRAELNRERVNQQVSNYNRYATHLQGHQPPYQTATSRADAAAQALATAQANLEEARNCTFRNGGAA